MEFDTFEFEFEFDNIDSNVRNELIPIVILSNNWLKILDNSIRNTIEYECREYLIINLNEKTETNIININIIFNIIKLKDIRIFLNYLINDINRNGPKLIGNNINYAIKSLKKNNVSIDITEYNQIFRCNGILIGGSCDCNELYCICNEDDGVLGCGCIDTCRCDDYWNC